jgi:hypothetical protein
MRKSVIIPTYWSRKTGEPWLESDAVYDHPTPIDQKGTLGRTLESMKVLHERDFKLVILICPTAPELEEAAFEQVLHIVRDVGLNAETYLFTAGDLREMSKIFTEAGLDTDAQKLLCMTGYANVRNMCLLAASILSSDVTILIDDDEVFESPDFMSRATEFVGKRVYGDVVHGVAGYYLNKEGKYYDDVVPEAWMAYWNRFEAKARAFDKIIGSEPRIKRTPFAFGGAAVLHRELFECVPFDPMVPRGEDVDYLINGRMYGFSFFLDNTLSIKHLPEPKSHPQWMRFREDIYRFVYQREKMMAQTETGSMVLVHPEQFDPYPGEFLKNDLEDKIYRGCMMLAVQYMAEGDMDACREALRNIYIAKYEAPPKFNAFNSYRETQKHWDSIIQLVRKNRYELRAVLEHHNLSSSEVIRDEAHIRRAALSEILRELRKIPLLQTLTEDEIYKLSLVCQIKTYYARETIFAAGDYNGAVHIVLKGKIRLSVHNDKNSEIAPLDVAYLGKGDPLGESCLFYDTFKLNGTAEEFTELLFIRKTDLNNILLEHPALGVKLLKLLLSGAAAKMDRSNEKLKQAALYDCNVVDPSAVG